MLTAITHQPSNNLSECNLTFLPKMEIDLAAARKQHAAYCKALKELGIKVITLDKNLSMPDSVFVEDTALVFDEIAVMTSMGASSIRSESDLIATQLSDFRTVERIALPARIDGGDVLRIGKKLFVGNSTRTNKKASRALHKIVSRFGYEVTKVKVSDCLHLKSGCTALDENTVLINPEWIDRTAFATYKQIEVPISEPFAANILRVGKTVFVPASFKRTIELVSGLGYKVQPLDISEFLKAEAGLTCMSIIFASS